MQHAAAAAPPETDLAARIDERYFEDYPPGARVCYGPISVSADEIVEFARKFDPQEFHVDAQRATAGPFGGLVASGWHTASLMMRVLVDRYLSKVASLGSPGIDELRWLAPVRPGDQLWVRIHVVEARRSQSKPDRGLVRSAIDVCNEHGESLMTLQAMTLMRCRTPATAGTEKAR